MTFRASKLRQAAAVEDEASLRRREKGTDAFERRNSLMFFATGLVLTTMVRGFFLPVLAHAVRSKAPRRRDAWVVADAADPTLATVLQRLQNAGCPEPLARDAGYRLRARATKAGEIFTPRVTHSRRPAEKPESRFEPLYRARLFCSSGRKQLRPCAAAALVRGHGLERSPRFIIRTRRAEVKEALFTHA